MSKLEPRILEIGEELLRRVAGEQPGVFNKAWWSGQILDWAMRDPGFKTEMFRFVDVFPVLETPDEIYRHVREYLLRPGVSAPTALRIALKGAGMGRLATRIAAGQIEKNLVAMARNFIVGTDAADALPALAALRKQRQSFTVDLLGEATISEAEADACAARYLDLLDGLTTEAGRWPDDPLLDADDQGPLPRVNVSIKPSALSSRLDPTDFDGSVAALVERLRPLFLRARSVNAFVNLDLEQSTLKDITYAAFEQVMADPALAGYEQVGVVLQAYRRDAVADLDRILAWARRTRCRLTIRLVKGAYWDYETVTAGQEGWPTPVWRDKSDADACFEACAEKMLAHHRDIRSAIGSHNVRSLACAMAWAEHFRVPITGYEIQCLYGMAEPIKAACVQRGHRVRIYAPVGELLPGMAYLVRRLLENTSNQSWLRLGFAEHAEPGKLLAPPVAIKRPPTLREPLVDSTSGPEGGRVSDLARPFVNEPLRDFSLSGAREAFAKALVAVETHLGVHLGPVVGGRRIERGEVISTVDPADGRTVVAHVTLADAAEVDPAVRMATEAAPSWAALGPQGRAEIVAKLAAAMRRDRDTLSALMVREVGKPWREADADVCEAIDFCEFYAREALRLFTPRPLQADLPGEINALSYVPRGVTAVIAPWNFPLAILSGMSAAALVTGNTVIMKPAEQSVAIGARLHALALASGVPPEVLAFLPGRGEAVGAALVEHPWVSTVAFTGSRAVGLAIWAAAGQTRPGQRRLKRVVCEMGGKNALIVDTDADPDEAALGVLRSAFGYAGQKCSAASRVIVMDDRHDAFVDRLVAATRSLVVAPPRSPGCRVGPVIDAEAFERLSAAIEGGARRGKLRCGGPRAHAGYYIDPVVLTDLPPGDPLLTDELFGPVLCVQRAADFEDALRLAMDTEYALTAGVYSRSPAHIERARAALVVGNLYINRPITGAMVGRHPFGGFGMSGGGTKAGGPDYLLSFVDARAISENTLRRGFAPE